MEKRFTSLFTIHLTCFAATLSVVPDIAPHEPGVDTVDDNVAIVVGARETVLKINAPHQEPEFGIAIRLHAAGS